MKFRMVDIGRNKVTRVVEVTDRRHLYREVGKHLMSKDIEIGTDGIVYAGVHVVGRVEIVEEASA